MSEKQKPKYWWLIASTAVIVGTAGLVSVSALNSQGRYEEEARQQANNHAKNANNRIRNICSARPIPQGEECLYETRKAARENQRAEYDLEAQQTSALWTTIMGWMSALAVVLSAIGVYLIYRTFRQTQDQAEDMVLSVREAGRAASAMEGVADSMAINAAQVVESVRHQRVFGKMQMRAHVSVVIGGGVYQDENLRFEARPQIINSGHTAARKVRWRISAGILPRDTLGDFRFPIPPEVGGGSDLAPHQDGFMSVVVPKRVEKDEVAKIKAGGSEAFCVWGALSYEDVFGKTHRCTFAQLLWWQATGENHPDGTPREIVRGIYLPKHNRSN